MSFEPATGRELFRSSIGDVDEAVARARRIVDENDDGKPDGPELDEATRASVAETVGLAQAIVDKELTVVEHAGGSERRAQPITRK